MCVLRHFLDHLPEPLLGVHGYRVCVPILSLAKAKQVEALRKHFMDEVPSRVMSVRFLLAFLGWASKELAQEVRVHLCDQFSSYFVKPEETSGALYSATAARDIVALLIDTCNEIFPDISSVLETKAAEARAAAVAVNEDEDDEDDDEPLQD